MKLKLILMMGGLVLSLSMFSQINNPKDAAKNKSEQRTNQGIDRVIDRGLDKVEEGIGNAFKKKDKKEKPAKGSSTSKPGQSASQGPVSSTAETKTDKEGNTDYSAFKNFDFKPGEKILLFEDFSNGLSQWNTVHWDVYEESFKGGVTTSPHSGGHWYFMPRKGLSAPKDFGAMPDNVTIEFDMMSDRNHEVHGGGVNVMFVKHSTFDVNNFSFYFDSETRLGLDVHPAENVLYLKSHRETYYGKGIDGGDYIFEEIKSDYWKPNLPHRISITKTGGDIKLYVNQDLVIDLKNALPANEKYTFLLGNNSSAPGLYVTNVRIATGVPQPAAEIKENKVFITQSILFDVNSDVIRAGSYHILSDIAKSLKQVDGPVHIVGHTDNDGSAQHNLELSKKRAASVKRALVNEFGIDANRLTTDGKGLTEPLNHNSNASEKAQNRRVEFFLQ